MPYDYTDFIRECTAVLDGYSGDLPTAKARKHFHQQNAIEPEAIDFGPADHLVVLPAALEGHPHGKTVTVPLAVLLRVYADHECRKYPEHAARTRSEADDAFSRCQLTIRFCAEDEMATIREKNAASGEMLSIIPSGRGTDLEGALWGTQVHFCAALCFDYPAGKLPESGAEAMAMPTGMILHLAAASLEGKDAPLAAAIRRYADIHCLYDVEIEFHLPEGRDLCIWDLRHLDSNEAALLLRANSAAFRPMPGSIKLSWFSDERVYSPIGEADFPLKVYIRHDDVDEDDDFGNCILIGPDAAFAADAVIMQASAIDEPQAA